MNPTPAPALRKKYADLTKIANDLGIINFDIVEDGGKLQLTGTASYQLAKDELWNAIKRHGGWENDVAADIKVANTDLHGQYTGQGRRLAVQDRPLHLRRRQRLPEDLRRQPRHPEDAGRDPPRPDPEDPARVAAASLASQGLGRLPGPWCVRATWTTARSDVRNARWRRSLRRRRLRCRRRRCR